MCPRWTLRVEKAFTAQQSTLRTSTVSIRALGRREEYFSGTLEHTSWSMDIHTSCSRLAWTYITSAGFDDYMRVMSFCLRSQDMFNRNVLDVPTETMFDPIWLCVVQWGNASSQSELWCDFFHVVVEMKRFEKPRSGILSGCLIVFLQDQNPLNI